MNDLFDQSAQIQKIYSSSYYISLQIRIPGESKFLIIGRGHNYEGLWFSENQIPTEIRKKDRLLEYLRKHIAGCPYIKTRMDKKDRAICIHFSKWRRECELYFFYAGRELHFQTKIWNEKKEEYEYFKSWRGKVKIDDMSFSDFDEVGRRNISDKESVSSQKTAKKILEEEYKNAKSKGLTPKSIKFLKRKIKNIQNDLSIVENYKKIEENINEIDFESLDKKTKIYGVKINFKLKDFYNRRNETFIKIKKLKKAKEILTLRLEDTENKLSQLNQDFSKDHNKLNTIEPVWKMQKEEIKQKTIDEYIVKKSGDLTIGIGKSSKGNDQLRSAFASKEDWWFHLSDKPSTHIIVKGLKLIEPEIIDLIGREFCELEKCLEVDIVYTQVKNLKSIKGKSGLVKYKKEKYFRFNL